jgi:Flp pilus assembly protein TadD
VELSPKQAEILDTLGWVHYQRGQYAEAVTTLKQAADIMPQHPIVRYHLAQAYLQTGRKADAADEIRRALNIDPNFKDATKARELLATIRS